MPSGIDKQLRIDFFKRIQATEVFWKKSGNKDMFVDLKFHAAIGDREIKRPDEWENWPTPENPFPYCRSFKPFNKFLPLFHSHIEKSYDKIAVFPVNKYAWGNRIDGPYIHPISKLVTFTPRSDSDTWIHEWTWLNSGQAFFVALDCSWAIYTSKSIEPYSKVFLLADLPIIQNLNHYWPQIVDFIDS
jgi:hypothetical protein